MHAEKQTDGREEGNSRFTHEVRKAPKSVRIISYTCHFNSTYTRQAVRSKIE